MSTGWARWWCAMGATLVAGAAMAQVERIDGPPRGVTVVDTPLVTGAATFDGLTLVGALAPGEVLTLSADAGTLALAAVDGLDFALGDGDGDAEMRFSGPPAAVAAALDGLRWTPPIGFIGRATLTASVGPASHAVPLTVNAPLDAAAARARILAGVDSIHGGVQPGRVVAYGPSATEIGWYDGGAAEGAIIGAARWGAGRVIAVNDHQMLNMHAYGAESGGFYRNGLAWLAGRDGRDIAIVTTSREVGDWLTADGYLDVTVAGGAELVAALDGADVFVPPWLGTAPGDAVVAAVTDFVVGGGGLFVCDYGPGYDWWWNRPIPDAPGNQLLRAAGLGFPGGNRWDDAVVAVLPAMQPMTYGVLLDVLRDAEPFDADARSRAGGLLTRMSAVLPADDPLVRRLDAGFEAAVAGVTATPATPVSDGWHRALLRREVERLRALAPDDVPAHRSAEAVYGPVPGDAPRIDRAVRIDPSITRWHSTGVYAAPGEVITLAVPPGAVGHGFRLRIGGHTDDMEPRATWLRSPSVHWWAEIAAEETRLASPFGGAVYVDVGTDHRDVPPFDATVSGAVPAPYFVLGEMDDATWLAEQRDNPAPYAELVGRHVALSLPSSMIRDLERPAALMDFWDRVMLAQDAVGGAGETRTNGERINIDVQVSAGYLHAGYPTQGPLVSGPEIVNVDRVMDQGSWGWFHELGHEGQRRPDKRWGYDNPYTFDGSIECTVNVFTTYAYDHTEATATGGWAWTGSRVESMRRAVTEMAQDASYASVGVGVKLAMWVQLADFWGWETVAAIIDTYNDVPDADQPRGDAAKRDVFLVRASQVTGHDMTAFLNEVWGLELGDEALATVADLPSWMPAVGGVEGRFRASPGGSLTFDLVGEALSHDGVADVSRVGEGDGAPRGGVIVDEGGGRYTYAAEPGFTGIDAFTYVVTSSTGHEVVSRVEIEVTDAGVRREVWNGIPGTDLAALRADPRWPDMPDERDVVRDLESPRDVGDSYAVRLRAFLVPPADGDYTFWIASDDAGELWLSPDHRTDGAALIARVPGWTPFRSWDVFAEQRSDAVPLEAGQAYYIEALMKEGGGGDHLSVAWALSPDETPRIIEGTPLRAWREDNAAPIAVDDAIDVEPGATVDVDVLANDRDPDGDRLVLIGVDGAEAIDGRVRFTAGPDPAQVELRYTVGDGHGGVAEGRLRVRVGEPLAFELSGPVDGAWQSEGCLTFRWTAAPAAVDYLFTLGDASEVVAGTEHEACAPEGDTRWSVTARDGQGRTISTPQWTVRVDATPPTVPPQVALTVSALDGLATPVDTRLVAEAGDAVRVIARGRACHGADPGCGPGLTDTLVCAGPAGEGEGPEGWPLGRLLVQIGDTWHDAAADGPESDVVVESETGGPIRIALATVDGVCPWPGIEVVVVVGDGLASLLPAPGTVIGPLEFGWQPAIDDGSGIAAVDVRVMGPSPDGALAGPHDWWVEARDVAGNTAETPRRTVIVDHAPPAEFEIRSPAEGAEVWGAVEVCWSPPADGDPDGAIDRVLLYVDDVYVKATDEGDCLTVDLHTPGEVCVRAVARDLVGRLGSTAERCLRAEPLGAGCLTDDDCPEPFLCIDDQCAPAPDMGLPEPDMGAPEPDMASPEPDMASPEPDMASPGPDMTSPGPDMASPEPDMASADLDAAPDDPDGAPAGGAAEPSGCGQGPGGPAWPLAGLLVLLVVRRRRG